MSKVSAPKLSRTRDQRRALVKGLANSLVLEEKLTTTRPKAKLVIPYFEKLISWAKVGNLQARREIQSGLTTETAIKKLMTELGPRFAKRNGGYVKRESAGWRAGDNAELLRITVIEPPTAASPAKSAVSKQPQATVKTTVRTDRKKSK
ncbi:50S ribosomal protein L17 [Candidatus Microgenomates bacterium]|nr:50S ribosomal protein L17 [Candidatus Microgenomates bacterium]